MVIALLEFCRFASVREPYESAAWDAAIRRLEMWKRDAALLDQHRDAALQDRMGEDDYLPSKEELARLRAKVHDKLADITEKTEVEKRSDAVKIRRLVSTAILLDNFQRSGTIKNVTIQQYEDMKEGIMRAKEHKSMSSYGSANLVVADVASYLAYYVQHARPLLVKENSDSQALFPSSDPWDDVGEACTLLGERRITPTSAPEGGLDGSVLRVSPRWTSGAWQII